MLQQIFHSDYFSGWDEKELQKVLDNCDNDSEAANPNAFCSDWLTFRGKPKEEGVQVDDGQIESDLKKIQPNKIDTKKTISPEEVTFISEVPRGTCSGTLIPDSSTTPPPATNCKDKWSAKKCRVQKKKKRCGNKKAKANCRKTCGSCENNNSGKS